MMYNQSSPYRVLLHTKHILSQYSSLLCRMSSSIPVKVTSYNVLSSALADPHYFTHCKRNYLRADHRFKKLQTKLRKEIQSNAIICLQEVSKAWSTQLEPFFTARGYRFIPGLYGSYVTGNMGVAIAVPTSIYNIEDIDVACVAETKPKVLPVPEPVEPKESVFQLLCNFFARSDSNSKQSTPKPIDAVTADLWDNILGRKNLMICLRLSHLNNNNTNNINSSQHNNSNQSQQASHSFIVGTYHMPCAYQTPAVMIAHTALSTQHIQQFAKSDPYIFVGDYNFMPSSSQYTLVTTGTLDEQVLILVSMLTYVHFVYS